VYTGFWWGNLREDFDVVGKIILRWIFKKRDVGAWSGLMWLIIETGGGLL